MITPILRARLVPKTKLCYRCGKRFRIIDGSADHSRGNSEFERHDAECLQRAVASDLRRRASVPAL